MGTTVGAITYESSFALPENFLEEIIEGESRVMPPASKAHGRAVLEFFLQLKQQLEPGSIEICLGGSGGALGITKDPFTYRIPDLMVTKKQETQADELYYWTSPLLIFECLSPANRKGPVEQLLADYRRVNTTEIWIYQPEQETMTLITANGMQTCQTQGRLSSNALPGLEISIPELHAAFRR